MTSQQLALVGLVQFIVVLFTIWALIDLFRRPAWAFEAAHQSRTLWLVLLVLSLFCTLGIFVVVWYLLRVSSVVRNEQQLGHGPGFPGGH